jgi:hypothetical protein
MFRANHITTCNNNIILFIWIAKFHSSLYLLSENHFFFFYKVENLFYLYFKILIFKIFKILQITSSLSHDIFLIFLRNERIISLSRDFTNTTSLLNKRN